jgi:hypothetical protein
MKASYSAKCNFATDSIYEIGRNNRKKYKNHTIINNTNKSNNVFPSYYKKYSDINNGDITYYNNTINDWFKPEIYTSPSLIHTYTHTDPMNSKSNDFKRVPLKNDTKFCNSWIRDSTKNRENLMASQLKQIIKNKWLSS